VALSMLARRANFISSLIQAISPPPTFEGFFFFLLFMCALATFVYFTLICFPYSLNQLSYPILISLFKIVFEIELLYLLPS